MKCNAYAKINLGLDVIGKRADGYHEVRMIMQTIGLCDELKIERTDEKGIRISADRDDIPVNEDNLIYKACDLIMKEYGLPGGVKADLVKNIPVAAGLAGGSTDAAAAIRALNKLFDLKMSMDEMKKLGVRIGADVPYCVMGGTALAEGIGEKLTRLPPCPEWRVLIAKPPVSVSTAHVYQNYRPDKVTHPDIDRIAEAIGEQDFDKVVHYMGNVLESVTESEVEHIGIIKRVMAGNGGAPLMSGSGPTVFGLFGSDEDINRAYDALHDDDRVSDLFITKTVDPYRQQVN